MKDKDIFSELNKRFDLLKTKGYEVVFIALQGSQNYGLDLYTEEYKSDIDCIAVILPSLDDIVASKPEISTTMVLDNNEHINIKDIRQLFHLFKKQNIQFLELLFTKYKIVNNKYKDILSELFRIREEVAKMNERALYLGMCGMGSEKYNALKHPYPSILYKIEKWGYDGKQLHHLIRLNYLADNLSSGMSFQDALITFTEEQKQLLLDSKLNKFTLEEAEIKAAQYYNDLYQYRLRYKELPEDINLETENKIMEIKRRIIKQYFEDSLRPKVDKYSVFDINNYDNVFVTSDLHFGHDNILKFEDRKSKMNVSDITNHDNKLIDNWNSVVSDGDLVFILGDISFTSATHTNELLSKMKGDKILIAGNHDYDLINSKHFDKSLFLEIVDYKEIKYKDQVVCMMHYPIWKFKNMNMPNKPWVHLFGHIHSSHYDNLIHSFNVGVDVNNYIPVKIEYAIQKALEREI